MRIANRHTLALLAALGALLQTVASSAESTEQHARRIDPAAASYTYMVAPFTADYQPPAPGSYDLPVIDTVSDHIVLGSDGVPVRLSVLKGNRFAVVAFVYTTCAESAGCP